MVNTPRPSRTVIGAMTGTSIDGLDLAFVRITGTGLSMRAELIAHTARPLGDVGQTLRQLASGAAMTAEQIARAALTFGQLHAEAIQKLLADHAHGRSPDLIAVHGQTVFHQPPISWQLINPAPIAARFDCPVVFDLRQADLAAGGQGAPITPLADWIMFRDATKRRAIVNLGGFCNVTILPRAEDAADDSAALDRIDGFDCCACNQLLDAIARDVLHLPYDDRGAIARTGTVNDDAMDELLRQLQSPRETQSSLGTGDECFVWLRKWMERLSGPDLAATAVCAIARCISDRLARNEVDAIILAGGGVRHDALVEAITDGCSAPVVLSDAHGIPAEAREAAAMAILGALSADGIPITLPHITGCRESLPVSGTWIRPS